MEIVLKGREQGLRRFLKKESLWMKRNGISVEELPTDEPKLTANEIAEIIAKIELIEDLKQYKTDGRQTVVAAYKKKLKELE